MEQRAGRGRGSRHRNGAVGDLSTDQVEQPTVKLQKREEEQLMTSAASLAQGAVHHSAPLDDPLRSAHNPGYQSSPPVRSGLPQDSPLRNTGHGGRGGKGKVGGIGLEGPGNHGGLGGANGSESCVGGDQLIRPTCTDDLLLGGGRAFPLVAQLLENLGKLRTSLIDFVLIKRTKSFDIHTSRFGG